jgi:type II secretory ATPase GspE/PulE/Tfp pilus assembly ATPase PilB-like protein
MDTGIKGLLVGKPSVEKLREAATRAGMRSLRQAALRLAADGTTSLEEAARLTT